MAKFEFLASRQLRGLSKWAFDNTGLLNAVMGKIYSGVPPQPLVWAMLAAIVGLWEQKIEVRMKLVESVIRQSIPDKHIPSGTSLYNYLYRAGCCYANLCSFIKHNKNVYFQPTPALRDILVEALKLTGKYPK